MSDTDTDEDLDDTRPDPAPEPPDDIYEISMDAFIFMAVQDEVRRYIQQRPGRDPLAVAQLASEAARRGVMVALKEKLEAR